MTMERILGTAGKTGADTLRSPLLPLASGATTMDFSRPPSTRTRARTARGWEGSCWTGSEVDPESYPAGAGGGSRIGRLLGVGGGGPDLDLTSPSIDESQSTSSTGCSGEPRLGEGSRVAPPPIGQKRGLVAAAAGAGSGELGNKLNYSLVHPI